MRRGRLLLRAERTGWGVELNMGALENGNAQRQDGIIVDPGLNMLRQPGLESTVVKASSKDD